MHAHFMISQVYIHVHIIIMHNAYKCALHIHVHTHIHTTPSVFLYTHDPAMLLFAEVGTSLLDRMCRPLTSSPAYRNLNEPTKQSLAFLRSRLQVHMI